MTDGGAKQRERGGFSTDPVIEIYKRGIDRTLLRENLRKTPEERVRSLMALQRLAAEAHEAGRRNRAEAIAEEKDVTG